MNDNPLLRALLMQTEDQGPNLPQTIPNQALTQPPPVNMPIGGQGNDHKGFLKNMLGTFMYSLGAGLSQAAQVPRGMQNVAGLGGALQAPVTLEQLRLRNLREQQQMELQQAQMQHYATQDEQMRQMLQPNIAAKLASANLAQGRASAIPLDQRIKNWKAGIKGYDPATGEAIPMEAEDFDEARRAGIELKQAQTAKAGVISRPEGIYQMKNGKPELIQGTGSVARVTVTQEMADKSGLPDAWVGTEQTVKDINQMAAVSDRGWMARETAEGVMLFNVQDPTKKTKIGGLKPQSAAAGAVTMLAPGAEGGYNVIRAAPGQNIPEGAVTPAGLSSLTIPTSATRTMAEKAPRVIHFVDRMEQLIKENESSLGPLQSRWSEFTAGKVGLPNRGYIQLRTDSGLLTTALMNMHVGARGGVDLMKHFKDLIDVAMQDPENLKAALGEIRSYAERVQREGMAKESGGGAAGAISRGKAKSTSKKRVYNPATGKFE